MSRQQRLQDILTQHLPFEVMNIINESHQHRVPEGSESHFKIVIVASSFETMSRIARQRLIHHLVAEEFKTGLHALSLQLYTPEEWRKRQQTAFDSPTCAHIK